MYRDAIANGPSERISDLTHILDAVRKPLFVDIAHLNEAGTGWSLPHSCRSFCRARAETPMARALSK
jgi:hypothetical protein